MQIRLTLLLLFMKLANQKRRVLHATAPGLGEIKSLAKKYGLMVMKSRGLFEVW